MLLKTVEFTTEQKCAMIRRAEALIGTDWKAFSRDPKEGLDCYGLVMQIYDAAGIKLPDPLKDTMAIVEYFEEYSHWQFGDVYHVIGRDGIDHVGIVLTKNAANPFLVECVKKYGVRVTDMRAVERLMKGDNTFHRLKVS